MNPTPNTPPGTQIPYPPTYSAQPARRSRLLPLGLAGLGLGALICLIGAALLILSYSLKHNAAPATGALPASSTASSLPAGTSLPTETSLPTATNPPTATNIPATQQNPPPATATGPIVTTYSDDFSNSSSGWNVGSTDVYESGYNSSGFYEMAIKKAKSYVVANPPANFARPVKNVLIGVRAQPAQTNTGEYGVVCRFQDVNNFYLAGISGKDFYIGKQVNGVWSYLTNPEWQPLPDLHTDAEGYNVIKMSCIDSFIVLEVNGVGAAHVTDDTFSTGDVGLCVWAGDTQSAGGFYAHAGFDDFSAEIK
jgi:hypothetical protein